MDSWVCFVYLDRMKTERTLAAIQFVFFRLEFSKKRMSISSSQENESGIPKHMIPMMIRPIIENIFEHKVIDLKNVLVERNIFSFSFIE